MTETNLLARHRAVMPAWLTLYYDEPIEIVSGQGRRVFDANGNAYLDFFAGILTNAIGYGIDEISDAVRAQIDTGVLHTSTLYLIRRQVELAERIAQLSGIRDAKVFFTNSGSEANDTALMLATQQRRSHQVLALRNSMPGVRTPRSGSPETAPGQPLPCHRSRSATCTAATVTAARSATSPTRITSPPASPIYAMSSKSRPAATSHA